MQFIKLNYLIIATFFSSAIFGQNFYVSTKGNDKNNGSIESPVASLTAAQKLVQNNKAKNLKGITVHIAPGQYNLTSTFVLNEQDSGQIGKEIVWKAEKPGTVSITGGKNIQPNSFTQVKDAAIAKRLNQNAIKNIIQVHLPSIGITDFGSHKQFGHTIAVTPAPLQLFFNGNPMTLARYPNEGYIKIGKVIDKGSVPRSLDKSNRGGKFEYTDARHAKWQGQEDIWLSGTFNYGYADDYINVKTIDTLQKTVQLAMPHLYGIASGRDFQQYAAINILEELDMPGEWYLDRKSGILYFWPPTSMTNASIMVSMLEEPIIAMEGVSNVIISGITFEATRGIGMYMERGNHNTIIGCTVRNIGNTGIVMGQGALRLKDDMSVDDYKGVAVSRMIGDFQNHIYANTGWDRMAGNNHRIQSCDVYNTGSGGIFLSGGSKVNLINGNNVVDNCKVHDYNLRNKFLWAGINVNGCGNIVSHNEVYNAEFQGIFVYGNEHIFEYNNVHDVTTNSDDTSPWYIGRDPSNRGNIVRYNYFHHSGNANRMNMGIYCDDASTDVTVYGNVFYDLKVNHGTLFSNGGWDLKMKNNIIIEPLSNSFVISAQFYSWAKPQAAEYFGKNGILRKRLTESIKFDQPPYSTRYPSLLPYLDVIVEGKEWQGMRSRGNEFSGNVIIGGPDQLVKLMGGEFATAYENNNFKTNEDPGFVDMKKGNFMLKSNSIVFEKIPGFQPIPFDKMGLYKDTYRK